MRRGALIAGLALLAALWGGPLPALSTQAFATHAFAAHALAPHAFAAHMALHMGVVAMAAPLLGYGIAGSRFDPAARFPSLFAPLLAAMLEFAVVWSWHMPALHQAARSSILLFAAEQASFLAAGLLLWTSCFGAAAEGPLGRALTGTLALLVTSMHMTLLGALIALAPRPLYGHAGHVGDAAAQVADQQLGGIIMLLVGGAAYLGGGIFLMARIFAGREPGAAG